MTTITPFMTGRLGLAWATRRLPASAFPWYAGDNLAPYAVTPHVTVNSPIVALTATSTSVRICAGVSRTVQVSARGLLPHDRENP